MILKAIEARRQAKVEAKTPSKVEIFSRCKSHLDDADLMIAVLDGSQVDDGTAWEIGFFYARKSPEQKIIGITTELRFCRSIFKIPHQRAYFYRTIRITTATLQFYVLNLIPGAQDGLLASKKSNETVAPEGKTFEIT